MLYWIRTIRCGLDYSREVENEEFNCNQYKYRCDRYQGTNPSHLPFCFSESHSLYKNLFSKLESFIEGKNLLIVTDGALSLLPFYTLVKEPPPTDGNFGGSSNNVEEEFTPYTATGWLIDDHAITHFPSVASIVQLRNSTKKTSTRKGNQFKLASWANPLLEGDTSNPIFGDQIAASAETAQRYTSCRAVTSPPTILARLSALVSRGDEEIFQDSELINPSYLLGMSPIPDTAIEACKIAESLETDDQHVFLGKNATESSVKAMNQSGDLRNFSVLHFATHSLMGRNSVGMTSGLVFTPPEIASKEDDGYLDNNEIGQLDLDADLVILSACNTAAGTNDGEALSGLASSFLFANARSLMVSHWPVESSSAVEIVSQSMELAKQKSLSISDSLREALLQIKSQGGRKSHPSYWGSFVLIGDGDL